MSYGNSALKFGMVESSMVVIVVVEMVVGERREICLMLWEWGF